MLSFAEENYLKSIYHLSEAGKKGVSTNTIAQSMRTRPASVSDMIRKLDRKGVISYVKYQGVKITGQGKKEALRVIRKHRLWEVFLVQHLKFNWDQVHEVAEQLEHIKSPLLIRRLDKFLGHPKFDPHGDPIPDENGMMNDKPRIPLAELKVGKEGMVVAVKDSDAPFLRYLDKIGAGLGTKIKVLDKIAYDGSIEIQIDKSKSLYISKQVGQNILITEH